MNSNHPVTEKLPCSIVEDLLPLYVDDVCQSETKQLVEEHLRTCGPCSIKEQEYQTKLPLPTLEKPKVAFERLARSLRKKQVWISLISIACAILLAVFVNSIYSWLRYDSHCRVPVENIEFSDFQTLSDGSIAFHAIVTDGYDVNRFQSEKGVFFLARPYLKEEYSLEKSWQDFGTSHESFCNTYWCVEPNEAGEIWYDDGKTQTLIWKEGVPAPAARQEIEARFFTPEERI